MYNSSGNNPTIEELEELIEDADRDGSGSVDFQVISKNNDWCSDFRMNVYICDV